VIAIFISISIYKLLINRKDKVDGIVAIKLVFFISFCTKEQQSGMQS